MTCLASSSDPYGHKFVTSAYNNLKQYGIPAVLTPDPESLRARFPADIPTGPLNGREGYANPIGGWAEAGRATKVGLKRVEKLGGRVRGGCEVVGLQKRGKKVEGVTLKGGEVVKGDIVIVSPVLHRVPASTDELACRRCLVRLLSCYVESKASPSDRCTRTPTLCDLPNVQVRLPEIQATG